MKDLKKYSKAYYQAHKEQYKAYYQAHRQEIIAKKKAHGKVYYQANKEQKKASIKAWRAENKEYWKAWYAAHKEQYNAYKKAYAKNEVNSLGQTKESIRQKSRQILKQMNLHIDNYEIHHCFGYDDPAKFIYISKALHLKIHKYLRDDNIDASNDHWMEIRDLVNSTDEFMYIKC